MYTYKIRHIYDLYYVLFYTPLGSGHGQIRVTTVR